MLVRRPGSEGTRTGASSVSRAPSPVGEQHPGSVTSHDGARPEMAPERTGPLELSGLVTDAQGQPLEGVEVVLRANALSTLDRPVISSTDTEGRYRLSALPPGVYELSFRRERYLSHHVAEHVLSTSGTLDAVLEPAPLVEGRVVDEEGRPIPRTVVRLRPMEPPEYDGDEWDDSVALATSDETGHFVLDAPAEGPWRLEAEHRDYLYNDQKLSAPASGVKVVLNTGAGLEVVVVDEEDRPVAGADCMLVLDRPWPIGSDELARTDEQGKAVLSGVIGGRYLLMATTSRKEPFRLAEQRVELRERERRRVRLRFDKGVELAGVVVDGEGKPVAGAEVRALPEEVLWEKQRKRQQSSPVSLHHRRLHEEWDGKAGRPAVSGPDGRFVLRHLRPEAYRLAVSRLGYDMDANAMGEAFVGEGGMRGLHVDAGAGRPVRLVLSYRGFIIGRVVGPGAQPLTSFEVNGQALRSEDGTFALAVDPRDDGPLMLAFSAPGLALSWRRVDKVVGRDVELGDVVLGEGSPVRVRVVEAEGGGPVEGAGVHVWAEKDGQALPTTYFNRTGREGTVELPAMEPGVLVVKHEDYREARVPWTAGQREVTVTLRSGAVLQGWLRTDAGPVSYGKVLLYGPDGRLMEALEVRNGWYTQRGLAPGRYTARAESPPVPEPTLFLPREVDVPGDGTVELSFQSEPRGSTLKVPVSDEMGAVRLMPGRWKPGSLSELLEGLPRLHPEDTEYERHEQGTKVFVFRGLKPGRYTLLAWRERRKRLELHREEVEVPATTERTLKLQPRWQDMGATGPRDHWEYMP